MEETSALSQRLSQIRRAGHGTDTVSTRGEIDAAVFVAERLVTARAILKHFQIAEDAALLVSLAAELGAESRHVQRTQLRE